MTIIEPRVIEGSLMYAGHESTRAEVLANAREYLIRAGWHHLDADEALVDQRSLVARGWWGGDERGFVQEHHEGAVPVTLVHVDTRPREAGDQSEPHDPQAFRLGAKQ